MGETTKIEWTDSTWNPIRVRVRKDAAEIARAKGYTSLIPIAEKMAGRVGQHCEHVSPGCEHCYAESNNHRCLPANGTGLPYDRRSRDLVEAFLDEKALLQPLHYRVGIREGQSATIRARRYTGRAHGEALCQRQGPSGVSGELGERGRRICDPSGQRHREKCVGAAGA